MLFKKKYFAVFLTKEQNSYSVLAIKKFSPLNLTLKYQNEPHIIDISKYTYSKGIKLFYCIEFNKGQIFFKNGKNTSNLANMVDIVNSKKIITQIISGVAEKPKIFTFINLILILFGCLLGYIIKGFV